MQTTITVTGVHEEANEQTTMKFDGITKDDAARQIIFELPWRDGLSLKNHYEERCLAGTDLNIAIDSERIIRDLTFENAARAMAQNNPTVDPKEVEADQRILDQITRTAHAVAEHEVAIAPLTRRADNEIFPIAQARRAAEAELNRLLTARVNSLSARYKESL